MSRIYAISARVQITRADAKQASKRIVGPWTRTQNLPTFYLLADVQGITSEDHARRIAVGMLESLGHSPEDIHVHAVETSMGAH